MGGRLAEPGDAPVADGRGVPVGDTVGEFVAAGTLGVAGRIVGVAGGVVGVAGRVVDGAALVAAALARIVDEAPGTFRTVSVPHALTIAASASSAAIARLRG